MDDVTGGIVRYVGKPFRGNLWSLVEGSNGKLYSLDWMSGHVIEIDPSSGKTRRIGEAIACLGRVYAPYAALMPADNGCLYVSPIHARRVVQIDPESETVREIGPDLGKAASGEGHYGLLTRGPNGCLYAPPLSRGRVLEINPSSGQVSLIGDEIGEPSGKAYFSFTLAKTGCLFAVPSGAAHVVKLDPWTRSVETIGEPIQPGVDKKYVHSTLAKNGKLYAAPWNASGILEVDPDAGGVRQLGESLHQPGPPQCFFTTSGEKLWAVSWTTSTKEGTVLEFDPRQGAQTHRKLTDILHLPMRSKQGMWCSHVVQTGTAGNGRVYIAPRGENMHILEFDPDIGVAREIGEPLPGEFFHCLTTTKRQVFAVQHAGQHIVRIDYLSLPRSPGKIQVALQGVLSSGESPDTTIHTSHDKTYRAHKLILLLRSRVFQAMFAANMREVQDAVVELGDVSPSVSDMFMQYLYCEDPRAWRISAQELCELSSLAHRYEIEDLVDGCAGLLQASIRVSSAMHLLKFADLFQRTDLKQACLDFIVANREAIVDTDEWDEIVAFPTLLREVAEALVGRRSKKRKVGNREFDADTDWTSLTLPKLRRACAERGLGQDGYKQALIERLQA